MTFTACLLRTHIGWSPNDSNWLAKLPFTKCNAEVGNIRLSITIDQNIPRLDVTMNDLLPVSVVQGVSNRRNKFGRLWKRWLISLEFFCEIRPFDPLRNDIAR